MQKIKPVHLVYSAVILIAISNAIKGASGLYGLNSSLENLVASILLSVGVEVLLFYSVLRWSAGRTVPTAIYSSLLAVGAALLNTLFFAAQSIEVRLAIALGLVGPVAACIGGLVVGEGERNTTEEKRKDQEYELELARQVRLTALHERKKVEGGMEKTGKIKTRKTSAFSSKKQHILTIMGGKTPQEVIAETGYGQSYVYQIMRGDNGRD